MEMEGHPKILEKRLVLILTKYITLYNKIKK